jgi:signal transduction histidine kinase
VEREARARGHPYQVKIRAYLRICREVNGSDLRQVFLNLLLNAYEAIRDGGEILVDAVCRDQAVVVTVSDNGPGIAFEQLERIFEPFFTTKGPGGTGLGLSIAKNIIDSFGVKITASNASQGGAVFKLKFPVASHPFRENRGDALSRLSRRCCLLLVGDDLRNLEALKEVLLLRGH